MSLEQCIRAEMRQFIESAGAEVTKAQVTAHAITQFEDDLDTWATLEADKAKRKWVASLFDDEMRTAVGQAEAMQQGQTALPGMKPPAVISMYVNEAGDVTWLAFRKARWQHLERHERLLATNLVRAQASLLDWRDKKDALAPVMRDFPDRTVEEAEQLLSEASA